MMSETTMRPCALDNQCRFLRVLFGRGFYTESKCIYFDFSRNIIFSEKCQREFVSRMARSVSVPSLVQISIVFLENGRTERQRFGIVYKTSLVGPASQGPPRDCRVGRCL